MEACSYTEFNADGSSLHRPRCGALAGRVLRSRWLVLAAGLWLQSVGGSSYDFSIYSQSIKDNLGYSQQQLDSISFGKDIGANVGILSGLLYDATSPWTSLSIAAALAFVGNLMTWLSITGKVAVPSVWLMCFYSLVAANAQTFTNTAVVVTCVKNFPRCRGTVVGLMKGALGLSGAILVQIYYAIYGSKPEAFPLLITWLLPSMCIFVIFIIKTMPLVEDINQIKGLNKFSVILLILAAYLLGVIILQNCISVTRLWRIIVSVGIVIILVLPMWVVIEAERYFCPQGPALLYRSLPSLQKSSFSAQDLNEPKRGDNRSLLQAVRSLDFWFLFFAAACGMGSGLTTINNMSQLGSSLGYNVREINTSVSLWSIWNFAGRFGAGHISEMFLQSRGVARPLFISITLGIMVFGHIIIAVGFTGALYFGPILVGICYGAQWSLMPSTASELFGLQSFGAIFNTLATASPLSSYILSVQITGYLYDQEAEKGSVGSFTRVLGRQLPLLTSDSSCSGAHCFRLSFFIMACVCLAGSCTSAVFFFRTRGFYMQQFLISKASDG